MEVNSLLYFLFALGLQGPYLHTRETSTGDNQLHREKSHHCPSNEVDVDCINPCNDCRQLGICEGIPYACKSGCDCRTGYFRNSTGACVLAQDCKNGVEILSSFPVEKHERHMDKDIKPHCPKNEIFLLCGSGCRPTCDNPQPNQDSCDTSCVMACFCKPGYLRNKSGQCIRAELCTERSFSRKELSESVPSYEPHGCPNNVICDVFCQTMYNKDGRCLGAYKRECHCS